MKLNIKIVLRTFLLINHVQYTMLFMAVLFLFREPLIAQTPDTLWTKTFGGNNYDVGKCVQQTADSGYIITGFTTSNGNTGRNVWLIRTDINGDTLWTKTYGGIYWDEASSVQQTSDGGYIITGYTKSYGNGGGHSDVWLIKTDAVGDTMWTRTFGSFSDDYGYSVKQTADSGYIVTGQTLNIGTGNNVYLIKTDASGDSLWTKSFGGSTHEAGYSVLQNTDGGYFITGVTWSPFASLRDVLFIKTNNAGDTLWTRVFGNLMSDDWSHSVQQTADGGYIISGETTTFGAGGYDVWLIKTDAAGDTLWTKTFGGTNDDYGYSVQQTTDEGYIIAGYTESFGAGNFDVYLIRTDPNGDIMWTNTYGGILSDFGNSVQQTANGGFIITGYTISYGAGAGDAWLINVEPDISTINETHSNVINEYELLQNYPNPFNPETKISYQLSKNSNVQLKVYNLLGQEVITLVNKQQNAGNHSVTWNGINETGQQVASGVYYYKLVTDNEFVQTKKLLLLR